MLAAVYGLTEAAEEARRLEAVGVDGVFTFEGPHDVFIPLALAAHATDLGRTWPVGADAPVVSGPVHYLAWWLLGRGTPATLTSETGALPRIGPWAKPLRK